MYRCVQVRGSKQLAKQVRGLHDAESAAADLRAAVRELPDVATTVREMKNTCEGAGALFVVIYMPLRWVPSVPIAPVRRSM
jgi:hypothetical protein